MLKKPSFIMPFGYITIVVGTILDYLVFGQRVDWLVIVGMVLTSSGLMVKLIVNEEN
jgi:drug/metabolite transporter (DMT)-like permease